MPFHREDEFNNRSAAGSKTHCRMMQNWNDVRSCCGCFRFDANLCRPIAVGIRLPLKSQGNLVDGEGISFRPAEGNSSPLRLCS